MPKIRNILLKNKEIVISTETVKFDDNGIGEIKSDTIYNSALALKNFSKVEEDAISNPEQTSKEDSKEEILEAKTSKEEEKAENPVEDSKEDSKETEKAEEKKTAVKRKTVSKK